MIEISNVCKTYETGNKALRNVSITIGDGEFVFIMGRSGSGKSTLMKLLLKEVEPTSGKIVVNDMNLGKMPRHYVPKYRRRLGMVFQDFRLIQELNVYENVAFVLRIADQSTRFIKQRVPYVLNLVDLAHKARSKPKELSGGEQQRVAIARALANDPGLIIADEPTGNIDPRLSYEIVELLKDINRSAGTTIIMVTHEHDLVRKFHQRVVTLKKGRIISDVPADKEAIRARPDHKDRALYDEPMELTLKSEEKEAATV